MTFRAGRALSSGLAAWGRSFLPAVGVAALCWAPIATLLPGLVGLLDDRGAGFAFFCFMGVAVYVPVLVMFLSFPTAADGAWIWVGLGLFAQLLQLVAMAAIARRFADAAATWAEALIGALTNIVALAVFLLGAILLLVVTTFAGLIVLGAAMNAAPLWVLALPTLLALLVIPCRYWVALPVLVVERVGFWRALGRSGYLTEGCRFRVFGLVALLYVVPVGFIALTQQSRPAGREEAIMLASVFLLAGIVLGSLRAAVATHTYLQLCAARDATALSRVFD